MTSQVVHCGQCGFAACAELMQGGLCPGCRIVGEDDGIGPKWWRVASVDHEKTVIESRGETMTLSEYWNLRARRRNYESSPPTPIGADMKPVKIVSVAARPRRAGRASPPSPRAASP